MNARFALLAAALVASAAQTARGEALPLRAAPLVGRIVLDGRLDEAAWNAAEPFRSFVRISPRTGGAPDLATEVRVLRGPHVLYVGIRCRDPSPAEIVRPLGRRDHPPRSDSVVVLVDADRDRRTSTLFSLTAGGVPSDALVYDDDRVTFDWDAVWDGATAIDADGWSAELALPTSALGGALARGSSIGFGVIREVARTHERSATFLLPRDARGLSSRLGELAGVSDLGAPAALSIAPYLSTRVVARPLRPGADGPTARVLDPMADAGLDLRARLGSLTLAGALSPDFGQVEADQIVPNLTTFETFFPEKRPFFTEGLDVFQPVGAGNERVPQQLFYSRRVGLGTPILAAAKLVGPAGRDLRIGLLDAVVAATGQPSGAPEGGAARGLRWSPAQPLRLAPGDAYPVDPPAPENRLAAVARWRGAPWLTLGVTATSARAIAARCTAEEASRDSPPARCLARSGEAIGADAEAVSTDAAWYAYGQLTASRSAGGPPARLLPDGTILRPGDVGTGGYVRAGRRGGEPWLFDLGYAYASPRLDVNASGFQRTQNEQEARARIAFSRPHGAGPLEEWEAAASGLARVTTDGRGLVRELSTTAGVEATLARPYLTFGASATASADHDDVREIAGTGIPARVPGAIAADCHVETDPAKRLSVAAELHGSRTRPEAPLPPAWSGGVALGIAARPHPRVETRLSVVLDRTVLPLRHVGEDGAGGLLFARAEAPSFSLLATQLLVLARRLTLQFHGQLFTSYERYDRYLSAARRGTATVRAGDLAPGAPPAVDPGGRVTALVLDAVLRWEVRPGATLFVVYARDQAAPGAGADAPRTLAPVALGRGPATDALLVKWSFWAGG